MHRRRRRSASARSRTGDGRFYVMRIWPYLTREGKVDGAVLVLVDVDDLEARAEEIQRALDRANAIVATVREPLLILDGELRVEKANRAFYETFRAGPQETQGRLLCELGGGQWDCPALRDGARRRCWPQDSSFEDFEVERRVPRDRAADDGRSTPGASTEQASGARILLVAIEDRTEIKRAEQGRDGAPRPRAGGPRAGRGGRPPQGRVRGHRLPRAARAADRHRGLDAHPVRGQGGTSTRPPWPGRWPPSTAASRRRPGSSPTCWTTRASSPARCELSRRPIDLVADRGGRHRERARGGARPRTSTLELSGRPRGEHRPGRPRPHAAGALEPLLQRGQVHAARRARPDLGRARGDARPPHRHRHRPGASASSSCPTSSSASARPRARQPARQAGLGLGLTLVRQLVELHGGTVRAESAGEGRGATFTVAPSHPRAAAGAATEPSIVRPRPVGSRRGPTWTTAVSTALSVLVVDDDADMREALVGVLEQYGARGDGGRGHGGEAMTAVARRVPDVLVSDIGMPGEDGYELIRRAEAAAGRRAAAGCPRSPSAPMPGRATAARRSRPASRPTWPSRWRPPSW